MILKVAGSSPVVYPIFINIIALCQIFLAYSQKQTNKNFLTFKLSFIPLFFKFNYNILNEGLLIDLLQKKSLVLLLKKFIFKTFYIFNDRYIFEKLVFYFIELFIWTKNFFLIQDFYTISFFFQYFILLLCLILSIFLIIYVWV